MSEGLMEFDDGLKRTPHKAAHIRRMQCAYEILSHKKFVVVSMLNLSGRLGSAAQIEDGPHLDE